MMKSFCRSVVTLLEVNRTPASAAYQKYFYFYFRKLFEIPVHPEHRRILHIAVIAALLVPRAKCFSLVADVKQKPGILSLASNAPNPQSLQDLT